MLIQPTVLFFPQSEILPLSGQDVQEFKQKLAKHLGTRGGQVDLQAAQTLVHGLGGSGSHMRALMARPVGAPAGQETHQNMN